MQKHQGFSLVELMVAVTIIGILAILSYPSYLEHVTKTRRADGKAALLDAAARMERYYSMNNTYATATIAAGNGTTDILSSAQSPEGWYSLSISASNATSFTLLATPLNAQGTSDTRCQSLTYNGLGVKGLANGPAGAPTATVADCW